MVFDDGTGDKKSKYEVSEGGNVRGQYLVDQPDGYVRDVQYTADDLKGFVKHNNSHTYVYNNSFILQVFSVRKIFT